MRPLNWWKNFERTLALRLKGIWANGPGSLHEKKLAEIENERKEKANASEIDPDWEPEIDFPIRLKLF